MLPLVLASLAASEMDGLTIPKFVPRVSLPGWTYWSDVAVADGCRLQRHAVYNGFRLLDAKDKCVAAGSRVDCDREMERRLVAGEAKPPEGEVVILLHGVLRHSASTFRLGERLTAHGFKVVRLDYASTCKPIETHAENLRLVVASLHKAETIHLVGHSMGGLVIRKCLSDGADARVKRVVMMGTPNHGAELADLFSDLELYRLIMGPAGRQLCTDSGALACEVPKSVDFAVIAGGVGRSPGINPLLRTDNDGIVTVESTKLPGASDFLRLPVYHGRIVRSPAAADAVARFLRHGAFRPAKKPG